MSILIAYFSRAGENYFAGSYRTVEIGNTQIAADYICELTGADVFRIEMTTPYSDVYKTCVAQSISDFKANARPEIKDCPDSLEAYDTIILAYPCFCGTAPMAVFTFLEHFNWDGKRILPLCTNEGSAMGRSEADIMKSCPSALICKGLPVIGGKVSESKSIIANWLCENHII